MKRVLPRAFAAVSAVALALMSLPPAQAQLVPQPPARVPVSTAVGCDPLDPSACLLPFPNDFFTTPDPATDTGLRLNFLPTAMPRNGTDLTTGGEGKPIDPTEWNRNDGFSPGSMVMTYVPGIDLHQTWGTQERPHSEVGPNVPGYFDHRDHIADIGLYARPDAPMVIINAETGDRHPFWSELDTHPQAVSSERQVLILRPAVNFEEETRYIVALRNLKDADGNTIEAGDEFSAYRDGAYTDHLLNGARQRYFNDNIFGPLQEEGIARNDLYLAWDFTVASERNLAERALHIRDDAFAQLGDTDLSDRLVPEGSSSPEFVIDEISTRTDNWTDSRGRSHSMPLRVVKGRVTVPNYLDRIQQTESNVRAPSAPDTPVPGSRFFHSDLDGLPDQNPAIPTVKVPFVCEVPLNGEQNIPGLYGHGLLGTRGQVGDFRSPRRDGNFFGCGVDWWGMATGDVPTVALILADLSNFPSLADRAQQGFLNFMFVGRAAVHPQGFASDEAFQQDGRSLIKTADDDGTYLVYDGNSQGGIMGGALMALSPDIHRGILGVPAMNYSTLLNRSVDWEPVYGQVYYATYQDPIERQIGFSLIQMLWDRGEANGFAHHMTDDPYANTPPHEVMLQVAYSDHQVSNHAAEVEARTIGAPVMTPGLPDGRHWEMDPYFSETATYPYKGSALVYWDSGNAAPPNGNIPPSHGGDPHGHPRSEPAASWQEAEFLLSGWMLDVCGGGDYLTDNHPSNAGTPSCKEPDRAAGQGPVADPTPTPTETPTESPTPTPTPTETQPAATTLEFTSRSAESGQYSDESTFEALLSSGGSPVAGQTVTLEVTGGDGTETFETTTNADGLARVTDRMDGAPGSYVVTARFAGNDTYAASADVASFVLEREDSAAAVSVTGKGAKQTLNATLWDADSGDAVSGRTVEFLADGAVIGTATTDDAGRAQLNVPPRYRGGEHTFVVRFAGDDYYLPSEGSA